MTSTTGKHARRALVIAAGLVVLGLPAIALDEKAQEKEQLKACEAKMCEIVVKRQTTGADFACDLSKTWSKARIKEGVEKRKIDWTLGDARCAVQISLKRSDVLAALLKPEHTIEIPKQTIKCEVEIEKDVVPVTVTMSPKISFKDGKAVKTVLGVSEVEGPAIVKGAIWGAAKLEDSVGLFQADVVAGINSFLHQKCAKVIAEQK